MGHQKSYVLTKEQIQVFLSGKFGDGHISTNNSGSGKYSTNCIHSEYINFKKKLLGDISGKLGYIEKNGYSQTPIYTLSSLTCPEINEIKLLSISESLNQLTDLGVALWLYDDGSLHKDKLFYNINTHKFTYEEQRNYFIPFFNSLNIYPKIISETKKDGRKFYYLYISRYDGAFEITNILRKYPIGCYSYKLWDTEDIYKWNKLQEKILSSGKQLTNIQKGSMLRRMVF